MMSLPCLSTDPKELDLPPVGMVTLEDAESGAVKRYDTSSKAFREQVSAAAESRIESLRRKFGNAGIDFIHIDAQGDVIDPLVKFFRMRMRRMGR